MLIKILILIAGMLILWGALIIFIMKIAGKPVPTPETKNADVKNADD
jgi:hypothetical protein